MATTRLLIFLNGHDISDDLKLKDGKANPWGWSQYKVCHKGNFLGFIESGYFEMEPAAQALGYTFQEEKEK